jgi:excisionase family DNA binding protein
MNDKLTKREAAALLGIGVSTLGRKMREGKIKFTKVEAGRFESAVFFDRDDLAALLPSEKQPTVPLDPFPPVEAAPKPKPVPEAKPDTRTWAELHRDGVVPDSLGNYLNEVNPDFPSSGCCSLIGPPGSVVPPEPKTLDTTAHMVQALVTQPGPSANEQYINSLERHRDVGNITSDHYDSLIGSANKARRMSGQERKQCLDRAAILQAFRFGYSR